MYGLGAFLNPRGVGRSGLGKIWESVPPPLHESGLTTGGTVWMRVRLPAPDVYGAATTVPGLSLLFDPMELERVQWDTVRPENLAKIASRTIALHRDLQ